MAANENRNGADVFDDIDTWIGRRNAAVRGKRQADVAKQGLADSLPVRIAGDSLAGAAGLGLGVVRGAVHTAQDLASTAKFVAPMIAYGALGPSLGAPLLPLVEDRVHSIDTAGRGLAAKVVRGVQHPGRVGKAVVRELGAANRALNPYATPTAPTPGGEMRRRFHIGENQGELGFDVGVTVVAPEAMEARTLSPAAQVSRWVSKGTTERLARYLAEPYPSTGMGSHLIPRRVKFPKDLMGAPLPKALAGKRLPKAIIDSPFNVLKPPGISRGDMYEKHFQVDTKFNHARLPAHIGGGAWSGERLGIQKHGVVGRVIHGAPPALKRTVAGTAGAGAGSHGAARREGRR